MRLWVALHGAECVNDVRIGERVIQDIDLKLSKIRLLFRFILGSLGDKLSLAEIFDKKNKNIKLTLLDKVCTFNYIIFTKKCLICF